jgi:hypothetical protein
MWNLKTWKLTMILQLKWCQSKAIEELPLFFIIFTSNPYLTFYIRPQISKKIETWKPNYAHRSFFSKCIQHTNNSSWVPTTMLVEIISFHQMKTKEMFDSWTFMFLIVRDPCQHKIIQNNWNHNSSIHDEEQETKMISLQAHNLKHRNQAPTCFSFFMNENTCKHNTQCFKQNMINVTMNDCNDTSNARLRCHSFNLFALGVPFRSK